MKPRMFNAFKATAYLVKGIAGKIKASVRGAPHPEKARVLKAPDYYAKRIAGKMKIAPGRAEHFRDLETKSLRGGWNSSRGYTAYNDLFGGLLGNFFGEPRMNLESALARLAETRGKRGITIVDDGAGRGDFLSQIKRRLEGKGLKARAIALTLHTNKELRALEKNKVIDKVVEGKAEEYLPAKEADAIFSLYGSISYAMPAIRKDHLLKFATSLGKGGFMCVGFALEKGLSASPIGKRRMQIETEMMGVERAFEKRGFRAKFYGPINEWDLPNWVLIAQRAS